MIKGWAVGVITLAMAVSAQARLGETISQIEARYGKANNTGSHRSYQFGSLRVGVSFANGVSVEESYSKSQQAHFTEEEIQQILAANSQGKKWKAPIAPREKSPIRISWEREDGARARIHYSELQVYASQQVRQALEKAERDAKAKSVKIPSGL